MRRDRAKEPGSPSQRASGRLLPYIVMLVGLVATIAVVLGFHRSAQSRDVARFERAAERTRHRIGARVETYLAALLATRGLFIASDHVSAEEFRFFVSELELDKHYPGIQGIGFSRRIAPEERETMVEELRAQGFPDFRVWPDTPRDEIHAVVYVEPFNLRNRASQGYDMFTDPVSRAAMERARDTGEPAASGPVTLAQEIDTDVQRGFLIFVPIYRTHEVPATVEERRQELTGFVHGAFRMDDLLVGIFRSEEHPWVAFAVYDEGEPLIVGKNYQASRQAGHQPSHTSEVPLSFAGRTWTLQFESQPLFERRSDERFIPYIGGFAILATVILFFLSDAQGRHTERLRAYAEKLEHLNEDREKLLEATEAARAEAETASRAKDEFLAMLGHELRNPLAPIVTALELIKLRGELDDTHRVIERHVTHLGRLVDDLLDVSRITRGKVELRRNALDPQKLVARAVEMASPLLEGRGHHLTIDVTTTTRIAGDELRIAQVLANLLTNAAKYTEPGGHIAVRARSEGDEVVFSVEDDGIGIAPEMIPRMFDLFSQGARGIDRSQGGLGIGLTLVRRLVEAHGGTVEAHSEGIGRGSEFVVRLPAMRADETLPEPERTERPSASRVGTARVLVVDDNVDAADLLVDVLRSAGYVVAAAHDGPEALDVAASFKPEIAILDIGLPVMDGYELGERLKALYDIELLALTGYGQESDRQRSREAGFSRHLVKPTPPAELLAVVGDVLDGHAAGSDANP